MLEIQSHGADNTENRELLTFLSEDLSNKSMIRSLSDLEERAASLKRLLDEKKNTIIIFLLSCLKFAIWIAF